MRRTIIVLLVTLVTAACGGAEGRPDPASLETCDEVAEAVIGVIQESIDAVDTAADNLTEPDPAAAADLEDAGTALQERAAALSCSEERMSQAIISLADRLEARSVYGQLIIEGIKAGEGSFPGGG
jgi:hypothetical protein